MSEEKMNGLEKNMAEENMSGENLTEANQIEAIMEEENLSEKNMNGENPVEERTSGLKLTEENQEEKIVQRDVFKEENVSEMKTDDMYNEFGDPVAAPNVPKKKTGLVAGISVAAVVLVAAIVIILYFVLRKTPEEVVKGAVANTFGELKEQGFSEYNDVLGLSDLSTDDVDMVFEGTLNNVIDKAPVDEMSVKVDASAEKKETGYDFSLLSAFSMEGETANLNLYQIGNVFYYEMPEIYDAVFALDRDELLALAEAETPEVDTEEVKALYDKYMIPASEKLKESITYEKVDNVKITNANGDRVSCKQYLVTIPSEAVKEYVASFCDYFSEYATTYMTDYIYDELGLSQSQFNQGINSIKTYYALVFPSDFKFDIYVDGDKLARTDFNYKFVMLGANVSISVDFMGEDYVMRDINGTCTFSVGEEEAKVTFVYKQDSSSDELTNTANAKLIFGDEELGSYNKVSKYVISTGEYTDNMKLSIADEMNFYMDLAGNVSNINKGKSYDITIDSLRIYDDDQEYISLSGKMTFGNLDKEVVQPNLDNVVDYKKIIEGEDIDDYLKDDELNGIMNSLSETTLWGNFGYANRMKSNMTDEAESEEQIEIAEGEEIDVNELLGSEDLEDVEDPEAWALELKVVEDEVDYSGVALETANYTVVINDPEGFERGYADSEGISIYNDNSNIYYYIYTDTTIEECYREFAESYAGIDGCEVSSQSLETVNLSDGSELKCYVMKVIFDGSDITDIYYFFPLEGNDFVLCNAELWEKDADITATAELLVCNGVIEVQ